MKGGKADVLAAGAWLREKREALGASARLVASIATIIANRQGDPLIIRQQQLSQIENATEDDGPARLPSWFRYVRGAFDSGAIADAKGKSEAGEPLPDAEETFFVHNAAGERIGRLTLYRGRAH